MEVSMVALVKFASWQLKQRIVCTEVSGVQLPEVEPGCQAGTVAAGMPAVPPWLSEVK
jgi:hypothetical protein